MTISLATRGVLGKRVDGLTIVTVVQGEVDVEIADPVEVEITRDEYDIEIEVAE